jgi:hypothetical protein
LSGDSDTTFTGTASPPTTEPTSFPCKWDNCHSTFLSRADLTSHLSSAHVGSGKSHYDCLWEACKRNGDQHGFSSRQKICRHLQSHTGHRPFQCEVCKQNFSEAATLQQHMRRHTQESECIPFQCDVQKCDGADWMLQSRMFVISLVVRKPLR